MIKTTNNSISRGFRVFGYKQFTEPLKMTEMTKELASNLGVYCCNHVFDRTRPTLLVIRDSERDWQFLCGENDDSTPPHHIGVGHLIDHDASLGVVVNLEHASGMERSCIHAEWEGFELDVED